MISFTNNLDHSLANCFSLAEHVHSDLFVVSKGEYLESKQSIGPSMQTLYWQIYCFPLTTIRKVQMFLETILQRSHTTSSWENFAQFASQSFIHKQSSLVVGTSNNLLNHPIKKTSQQLDICHCIVGKGRMVNISMLVHILCFLIHHSTPLGLNSVLSTSQKSYTMSVSKTNKIFTTSMELAS